MQDLRLAFRALRATPVVTLVAILSLALGVGANTAMFSLVNSLLLRTLPVREPERYGIAIAAVRPLRRESQILASAASSIRGHAVDPDGRQDQRHHRERPQQHSIEPRCGHGLIKDRFPSTRRRRSR